MPKPKPETSTGVNVRARYFPTSASVTKEIQEWSDENDYRVLAIIPIYWEDVPHD